MRLKSVISLLSFLGLVISGAMTLRPQASWADHICVPNSEGVCIQPHANAFFASAPSGTITIVMEDDADLVTVVECTLNVDGSPSGNAEEGVASTSCSLPIDQSTMVLLYSSEYGGLGSNDVECGEIFPFTPVCFTTLATYQDCNVGCPGYFWAKGHHNMRVPAGSEILTVFTDDILVNCGYGPLSAQCETRSAPWI